MTTSKTLVTACFASTTNYEENLTTLISIVEDAKRDSIIVAPELALSDFDYEHFDEAVAFSTHAIEKLCLHVKNKTLIFTLIEKREDGFYNVAKVLHNGELIYSQAKAKLFKIGDEHHYFKAGQDEDIELFEIDGIKIGILICFELRFKALWSQLEGADIIAIPARWGKLRAQNFLSLSNALAIINQCYVLASDASNEAYTGESGIITPLGEESRNRAQILLSKPFEPTEIKKMRRYLDVGIL